MLIKCIKYAHIRRCLLVEKCSEDDQRSVFKIKGPEICFMDALPLLCYTLYKRSSSETTYLCS